MVILRVSQDTGSVSHESEDVEGEDVKRAGG